MIESIPAKSTSNMKLNEGNYTKVVHRQSINLVQESLARKCRKWAIGGKNRNSLTPALINKGRRVAHIWCRAMLYARTMR